ncbi:MAG: CheR family methyltransferase [Pseudomonadota bacterium]
MQVERLMTVSISRFFRDRYPWEIIKDHILGDMLGKNRDKVRVWSAGCACGEEAYSFKILWEI